MSNRPDPDDSELLREAREGNQDSFGTLYERHAPAIFRYLNTHLDNSLDAEDLTSEVFLRAWYALPNFKERGVPFIAFLFRIARNALIDHYRRHSHSGVHLPAESQNTMRDPAPGPAETLSTKIQHQELRQVLGQLRQDYRTVLVLRFIGDLSPEEISHVMKRSVGAVRVLQHRALLALRKRMQ